MVADAEAAAGEVAAVAEASAVAGASEVEVGDSVVVAAVEEDSEVILFQIKL